MKLPWVVALAIALAPVQSYIQGSPSKHHDLSEQVLYRRASPRPPADRSPSPPRVPERTQSPARPPSPNGESGSSSDGGRSIPRARVRARVMGPAVVRYEADRHEPRIRTLEPGKRVRFTVRGHRKAAIDVTTRQGNPPGRAEMTIRGRKWAEAFMDNRGEESGSITRLAPLHEAPELVTAGTRKVRVSETDGGPPERQKFKANIEGPGRMRGVALNSWSSATEQETSTLSHASEIE